MAPLKEIVSYTDCLLNTKSFKDYAPNGLQVEGRAQVHTLISGVSASRALIEAAVEARADALLVHHGYFWRGEDPCITGMKRERLALLLEHGISLLAYHLPLDAHPELGNNAVMGRTLGFEIKGDLNAEGIGLHGALPEPMSPAALAGRLEEVLGRVPLHIKGGPDLIYSIGWCTGAAQDYISQAAAMGLDAFVSGEVSERITHIAREAGIHYFSAGHHATERFGVRALGEHLANEFAIEHRFVDIDNPV